MDEIRTEFRNMLQEFPQQLLQSIQAIRTTTEDHESETQQDEPPMQDFQWESIIEELPAATVLAEQSRPKILKLTRQVKRKATPVTAGRDLHDIHTLLYLVSHWEHLQIPARNYAPHRLRLLYVAVT
jgi:hypothetical protein